MATEHKQQQALPDMSPRPDESPLISSADGKKKKKGIGRFISKLKRSASSRYRNGGPDSPDSTAGDESSSSRRRSSVEIADYDDHQNDKLSSAVNQKDSGSSNKKDEVVEKLVKPASYQQTSENAKSSTPAAATATATATATNVAGAAKEEVVLSQEAVPRKQSPPKVEKEKPSSEATPPGPVAVSDRQIHINNEKPPPTEHAQATATDTLASAELPPPPQPTTGEDNCVTSLAKGLQQICSGWKKEPAAPANH